jgi:hypothetical protein
LIPSERCVTVLKGLLKVIFSDVGSHDRDGGMLRLLRSQKVAHSYVVFKLIGKIIVRFEVKSKSALKIRFGLYSYIIQTLDKVLGLSVQKYVLEDSRMQD